jgi:hypothetical protein
MLNFSLVGYGKVVPAFLAFINSVPDLICSLYVHVRVLSVCRSYNINMLLNCFAGRVWSFRAIFVVLCFPFVIYGLVNENRISL